MRCYCCNNPLSGKEAVRRFKLSDTFTDMCDKCLKEISDDDIETVEGNAGEDDPQEDEEEE